MIGQSVPEYIFIRLSIYALRLVAPASIGFLTACAIKRALLVSPWLVGIAALETSFYLFVYLPRRSILQKPARHASVKLSRVEREALFERCSNQYLEPSYPTGWFLSPGLKRENVRDWLLWALFSSSRDDALEEWDEELDGYIKTIEKTLGITYEPGRNDATVSMRLTFDGMQMLHRPFIWYLIVGLVDHVTAAALIFSGFKHYAPRTWFQVFPFRLFTFFSRKAATPHFPYWYRPHRSTTKDPIVFIHGIGIGLFPYVGLFRDLSSRDPDVGILFIELLPISFHMTRDPIPYRSTMLSAISTTLLSHNIHRCVLGAHSYGTTIAAHVMRLPSGTLPDVKITNVLLMDPIPLLLHLPDIAFNFLYRKPRRANEWQLWYFASQDADVARTLWRYFFWQECVLWRDDLLSSGKNRKVAVSLSGADQIVRSADVWKYLTKEEKLGRNWVGEDGALEVHYHPELDHATVLDTRERRRGTVDVLERFVEKSE